MSSWLKKDDKVVVITGNDKGKIGVVLARGGDKLLIKGVNIKKKHMKKRTENGRSEIIDIEAPIHLSNVAACNADGKKIKLKSKVEDNGDKKLYYIEDGKEVIYRTLRTHNKK